LRQKASYVEIGASLQYEFEKEGFGKVKPWQQGIAIGPLN
jgi:hypothetical protein